MKQIKLKAKIGLTVFLTCLIIVLACGGYHLKNTIIQNNRDPITLSNKENTVVFSIKILVQTVEKYLMMLCSRKISNTLMLNWLI